MSTTTWQLHPPYPSRGEELNAETIWTLSRQLDGEDALVTRELLALSYRVGARTLGTVLDIVESLDADDRRLYVDACRKSAGLKTATAIDDERALELAQSAGSIRGTPMLQTCHHPDCDVIPLTESGGWAEVRTRKWHCAAHAHLAQAADLLDMPPPWRLTDCGTIVEVDETEALREAEEAKSRARARESQVADRELEAENRRKHQQALGEEARRLTPAGVWAPSP